MDAVVVPELHIPPGKDPATWIADVARALRVVVDDRGLGSRNINVWAGIGPTAAAVRAAAHPPEEESDAP
jgi:hypothetical protein